MNIEDAWATDGTGIEIVWTSMSFAIIQLFILFPRYNYLLKLHLCLLGIKTLVSCAKFMYDLATTTMH